MQDLRIHEQFEIGVLEALNSKRLLASMVFCGGTMLRLCFGLNRYSVDLDFWIITDIDTGALFHDIKTCLSEFYRLKDAHRKRNTLVFEIASPNYPRSLKLEIRDKHEPVRTERAIAYSVHSNKQVFLTVVSLHEMMRAKVAAFLDRKEIRDVFDIEFLLKRGIPFGISPEQKQALLSVLDSLTKNDYRVKLGSLLEPQERRYYSTENFKIVRLA